MAKGKQNQEKKGKGALGILLLYVLTLGANLFLIYNLFLLGPIEQGLRYILIAVLIFIDLLFFLRVRLKWKKPQRKAKILAVFLAFYFLLSLAASLGIMYVYGTISGMNKKTVTYTSSLVVLNESGYEKISDLKNAKIGRMKDKNSIEGYQLAKEIIQEKNLEKDNEIVTSDSYLSLLQSLYLKEMDAVFLPQNYVDMFRNTTGFEEVKQDTKILYSKSKKMLKAETSSYETASLNKSLDEPFTVLLMGVDSEQEGIEGVAANGDALILVTFNPKTLNATMLSIPRDSYVPIACFPNKVENKITHAAAYGTDCMMKTIENYFDVNIDYYAKINFKGIVNLVDTLGGIDVLVPANLCTDDSNREGQVCIQEGLQHLNGEQALVLARNRKQLANGDLDRGLNQQVVLQGIVNQIKSLRNVTQLMDVIETISNNFDTNFTTEQILSFYNIAKDILNRKLDREDGNLINIQQLYLQGTGQTILNEYIATTMMLWNYVPNKDSRNDVVTAMKQNLELEDVEMEKSFSFSINEPYEIPTIGYGPYKRSYTYTLLPDFTGDTQAVASSYAASHGIKVAFKQGGSCQSGTVCSQSHAAGKRVDLVGTVTLTIGSGSSDSSSQKEKEKEKDKNKGKDEQEEEDKNGSDEQGDVIVDSGDEEEDSNPPASGGTGNSGSDSGAVPSE